MTSQTLKVKISRARIDHWILKDWSLGVNKIKFWFKRKRINPLKKKNLRRIFHSKDRSSHWKDPFIIVTISLRFSRFGILIFMPNIDLFLLRINPQDLDFTLSLQNAFCSKEKRAKMIFGLKRSFSLRIWH